MTSAAELKILPHLWKSTMVSGLLTLILGVLILAWPAQSVLVAAIVFGIYLLVTGIAQVVFAFSLHVTAGARVLSFVSGAASLILAVLAFRHFGQDQTVVVWLLAVWIGIGFVFRGVSTAVAGLSDPVLPGRGWEIFFGVLSIIAGVVVLAYPFPSVVWLAIVAGAWMVALGVFEVIAAFSIRGATRDLEQAAAR